VKKRDRKILTSLVRYWDGKKFRYPNGPQPSPGGRVKETDLAKEMGYHVEGGMVLGSEWTTAVDGLIARQLVRRSVANAVFGEIQPTPQGMNQVDKWEAEPRWLVRTWTNWLLPFVVGVITTLVATWLVKACGYG